MKKVVYLFCLGALGAALLGGCEVDVFVKPATENIVDVEVEGESIPVEGKTVSVSTTGNTNVTWSYEGESDSQNIPGRSIDDGDTWTVYADYVDY